MAADEATTTTAPVRRLPVLRLVRHAHLDLVGNWRSLVQVGALWLVVPWVLHAIGGPLPAILGDLALTAGLAAIAVAWHRQLLLGEPLGQRPAPFRAEVARYLAYTVVIVLLLGVASVLLTVVVAVPGVLLGLAAGPGTEGPAGPSWLAFGVVVGIASLLVAMRLQLVLPAAATGDRRVTLAWSWRATRGNAWRLLAGFALVTLPVSLAGIGAALALMALADATGSLVLGWLARLAPIAAAWVQAPLLAGFLSYSYLFFTRVDDAPPVLPRPGTA